MAQGEAELMMHQISEILPVKGVTPVGPLLAGERVYCSPACDGGLLLK